MSEWSDIEIKKNTLAKLEEIMIDKKLKDTDETIWFLIGEYVANKYVEQKDE